MTDEEKQKLNEQLAERAGFEFRAESGFGKYWVDPIEHRHWHLPDFTDEVWGIAHCLKWLVPNCKVPIVGITFRYFPGGTECEVKYVTEAGFDTQTRWVQAKSKQADCGGEAFRLSALALCLAISQLRS